MNATKTTTTTDAHRFMLADIERQRAEALRTAKAEATAAITKLQRLLEAIEIGNTPSGIFDLPDTRKLAESIAVAETASRSAEHVRGWVNMINA